MNPTGLTARDNQRRTADAIAPKTEFERPLAFMSPSERMRLYLSTIEPMTTILGRLYEEHGHTNVTPALATRDGLFDIDRLPLSGDRALLEQQMLDAIKRARAKILGGVDS